MADKTKKENSQAPAKSLKKKYVLLENAKIDGYNREAGWKFSEGDIPDDILKQLLGMNWAKEA